jgi:3-dehydroquinate synthetase
MAAESHISYQKRLIQTNDYLLITSVLHHFFSSFSIPESKYPIIFSSLEKDKKKIDDKLNFSLLNGIGSAVIDQQVTPEEIICALKQLKKE